MKLILAACALTIGASAAVGCAADSASSSLDGEPSPSLAPEPPPPIPAPPPTSDAATAKTTPYRGNPLCRVDSGSCMPDDDGSRVRTSGTAECVTGPVASDAAAGPGDADVRACRIARDVSTGTVGPTCVANDAALSGADGASCEVGGDCAPGYDCIAGPKGTKTCRHYCCSGTCKGQPSQNGGGTFCDVQSLVDVNQKAPVCMPLKHCTLLGTGECAASETCAVVTESGDTGCVTIGEQQVGAPCDENHCAAKLTCLGQPGSRKCYKLCKAGSSECGPSQTCVTSTVFKDPTFGTCQKP